VSLNKTAILSVLGLVLLPASVLLATTVLDYQNRGDRYEGVRPKPVSGYDIEVISVLTDYKDSTNQVPDQLRVKFYLKRQTAVNLTVREQDHRLFYWMDKVRPARGWEAGAENEFAWPTGTVLKQLDAKLNMYELGVLVRLGKDTPQSVEDVGGPGDSVPFTPTGGSACVSVHDENQRRRAHVLLGLSRGRSSRDDDAGISPNTGRPAVHRAMGCAGGRGGGPYPGLQRLFPRHQSARTADYPLLSQAHGQITGDGSLIIVG
jgi:hypothetical protein